MLNKENYNKNPNHLLNYSTLCAIALVKCAGTIIWLQFSPEDNNNFIPLRYAHAIRLLCGLVSTERGVVRQNSIEALSTIKYKLGVVFNIYCVQYLCHYGVLE